MNGKEKDSQPGLPDVDTFERSAARAWHSRMGEIDPGDEAVLKLMAGEVIAEPNKAYDIYKEVAEIATRRTQFIKDMNA